MKKDGYELKPCPFCGSEVEVRFASANLSTKYYFVECSNRDCKATGPIDLGKSGAAEKWNSREEATDVFRCLA